MISKERPRSLQVVGWGFAWELLTEKMIKEMNISHCDPTCTNVLYETLRAARLAIKLADFGKEQIEDLFWNNAAKLFDLPTN